MSPIDVERRVEAIRAKRHDDEVAHGMEDELRTTVLEAIVEQSVCPLAVELAESALATEDIDFNRWCA